MERSSINDLRKQEILKKINNDKKMKFSDIFKIFPKTVFSKECGLHTTAFPNKIGKPEQIRVDEIIKISAYFEVPFDTISKLILADMKLIK